MKLYYCPGRASLAPHMALAELGAPYELVLVDLERGANLDPAYRKLNPSLTVPTLIAGEAVIVEAAAICLHLVDLHGRLGPALGHPDRPQLYRWLFYLSNTIQPALMQYHYPERFVASDDDAARAAVRAAAEASVGRMFNAVVEPALAERPYLLGDFGVCDLYLTMLVRWARAFERPPRTLANVGRVADQVTSRPAVRSVFGVEGIAPPYC